MDMRRGLRQLNYLKNKKSIPNKRVFSMSNRSINMSRGSIDSSMLGSNGELKDIVSKNSEGAIVIDNFESEGKNSIMLNAISQEAPDELKQELKEASSICNSEDGGWNG